MTTVGEPIEPEVWRWYYETVGKGEAVIVDTWWQTETGGFLCSTKPALDLMKPGSAGPAVLGIYPVIWDEEGSEVRAGSGNAGNICIRNPWPGIMQTIWVDPQRFAMQDKVILTIETMIGKIARPKTIHIVPDMPKTRSGKIMRRVLAAISNHMDTGDITTLANPDIVEQIRELVQGRTVGPLKEGPEDIKRFGDER